MLQTRRAPALLLQGGTSPEGDRSAQAPEVPIPQPPARAYRMKTPVQRELLLPLVRSERRQLVPEEQRAWSPRAWEARRFWQLTVRVVLPVWPAQQELEVRIS